MCLDKILKNNIKTLIIYIFKSASNYPRHRFGYIFFWTICASMLSDEEKVTPISFTVSALFLFLIATHCVSIISYGGMSNSHVATFIGMIFQ